MTEKKITIQRIKAETKEPTPEQCRGWMNQRVGKYHKSVLFEKVEDLKDCWANGDFTGNSTEETIQLNSEALGKVQAIADVIVTLEEMTTDDSEEENYTY